MRQTVKRIHQGGCYHLPYFNTMALNLLLLIIKLREVYFCEQ